MTRPDIYTYFMRMALLVATRSTCERRQTGCILVDHHNHVMSTGYNGVPRGVPHCADRHSTCKGRNMESGTGLDLCLATHAEQNALLQCKDVNQIKTCYTVTSPCMHCTKLLMNTSCEHIIFINEYAHNDAAVFWKKHRNGWIKLAGFEV